MDAHNLQRMPIAIRASSRSSKLPPDRVAAVRARLRAAGRKRLLGRPMLERYRMSG